MNSKKQIDNTTKSELMNRMQRYSSNERAGRLNS